ncbi:MAG TPA: DUF3299 domain-containing protein [Cellvibrionaceae bacterium]
MGFYRLLLMLAVLGVLGGCADPEEPQSTQADSAPSSQPPSRYHTIEWVDLIPADDLEALMNPPDFLSDIEDGSDEDQLDNSELFSEEILADDPVAQRYQQALSSARTIDDMDQKAVRIPGFIVPLEFDEEQTITEFFLVPFFGACIHVPPPPPNQVIYVHYPEGLQLEHLYEPFWISGVISVAHTENELAESAYSIKPFHIEPYSDYEL